MKKGLKITLCVLAGIIALDTLQAKILDNSPLLKVRENIDGGISYIDKGLLVNHYHCSNDEKTTVWKWTKYACPAEDGDLQRLKGQLGGYITSEKIEPKEEKLESLIEYDKEDVDYSYVMKSEIGVFVILKNADDAVIKDLDEFFDAEYKGYQTTAAKNYKIYVYNGENNFDLEEDIKNCLVD